MTFNGQFPRTKVKTVTKMKRNVRRMIGRVRITDHSLQAVRKSGQSTSTSMEFSIGVNQRDYEKHFPSNLATWALGSSTKSPCSEERSCKTFWNLAHGARA